MTAGHGGGIYVQGMDRVPQGPGTMGRFGRMFRELPVPEAVDEAALRTLSMTMRDDRRPPEGDNPDIPAGYTYLGQFIDHDITFDITPLSAAFNDPEGILNNRTPGLDLDSVYGGGPDQQPFLYDQVFGGGGLKLLVGQGQETPPGIPRGDDLPRVADQTPDGDDRTEVAIIGDPRNDENLIVSQIHVVFLKFHNRMVDLVIDRMGLAGDDAGIRARRADIFKDAQRLTRWHYQWVVAEDFCRRVCSGAMVDSILRQPDPDGGMPLRRVETRFYATGPDAVIPLEFSVAAYRIGHSMVRGRYSINTTITGRPIFQADADTQPTRQDFRGRRRLPAFWDHELALFFEGVPPVDPARVGDLELQPSRLIDPRLATGLFSLTGESGDMANLAFRNLLRGARLQLPAGQTVASAMGETVLTPDELGFAAAGLPADMPAPLWFYVLREAEVRAQGRHLGPVGGRIVAEVLLGLMASSSLSFLRVQPNWLPEVGDTDDDGRFTMTDLVNVAVHGMGTLSSAPMAPAEV